MGASYEYSCSNCGYREEISGEEDCGMVFSTRPGVCRDCKRLVDVIVNYQEWYLEKYPENGMLMNKCRLCKGTNIDFIERIDCPLCGENMKKGDLVAFWD